jgi:hypothetical protein
MKTNNKITFNAICNENGDFGIEYTLNFVPRDEHDVWSLKYKALTFMHKNNIMHMTLQMPDDFVNKNFIEVKATIIEE